MSNPQQNVANYEHLLAQILQPNTEAVQQAVTELNKLLKHPSSIQNLAHVLLNSSIEGVRQLAAVVMRKKLVRHWGKLQEDFQTQFREALLQRVVVEPSSLVRKSIGELIGLLGRLLVPMGLWPTLLPFLFQLTQSPQPEHREIAMRLFCSLSEHIPEQLQPHLHMIHNLFIAGLKDSAPPVALATLKGIGAFLELLENQTTMIEELFPPMKSVLEYCILNHLEDSVYAALETLDGLIELHYLPDRCAIEVLNMILSIGSNSNLERELRRRSLTLIDTFVIQSPKLVTDYNLEKGILSVLFAMGAEPSDEPDEEDPTELPNWTFVGQILDSLYSSIPTKFIYQPSLHLITSHLASQDPYHRRIALVALSVLVEGCVLVVEENIEDHLKLILPSFKDPSPLVREQAGLALALFSRELQPEIGKHHSQILPVLFEAMNDPSKHVRNKTCFALETFVEHLDEEILPYLEPLMQRTMVLLQNSPPNVQANIISVISAAATAAGPLFEPYFQGVLRYLEPFLSISDENHMALRGSATECVGIMINALKEKCPKDLITTMMQISIRGLEINNPELREYTFFFFANVAPIMNRELTGYLPTIVPKLWDTCESSEGIIEKEKQQEIQGLDEDSDDEEGSEGDLSVRTSFIDEKTAATRALGEIAKATASDFFPYVEKTTAVLEFLIGYFHVDVRQAAIGAFQHLVVSVHHTFPTQPWTRGEARPLHPTTQELVNNVMTMYLNILTNEDDKETVTACLAAIVDLIKLFGPDLANHYIQPMTEAAHALLTKQTSCFQVEEDYDDEDEEGDVVLVLFDSCCEMIVESAKVLHVDLFMTNFRSIFSALTKYLV